jgi:hypothetical protein
MSALGQKQTFAPQKAMSALPPKADICGYGGNKARQSSLKAGPKDGYSSCMSNILDTAHMLSCCCSLLPAPAELGAVNPDVMHDDGQSTRQRHDRLLHAAAPGDLHLKNALRPRSASPSRRPASAHATTLHFDIIRVAR